MALNDNVDYDSFVALKNTASDFKCSIACCLYVSIIRLVGLFCELSFELYYTVSGL